MGAAAFHPGELAVQERAGVRAQMAGVTGIRDFMPDQHRQFFNELSMLFIGAVDDAGQPWASVLVGEPGFITSPDARTLRIAADVLPGDPLAHVLQPGRHLGGLGLVPSTRRRNRVNGVIEAAGDGALRLAVTHSFGNCPQYIQDRRPTRAAPRVPPRVVRAATLSDDDRALIGAADTYFIASADLAADAGAARGADVSHRGGKPGFVRIDADGTLTAPDFIGNFFFNTIGNLVRHPRAGLLFIDYARGDLLHVAVDAEIVWDGAEVDAFAGAERLVRYRVREVVRNAGALPLRWTMPQQAVQLARTGDWDLAARVLDAAALAGSWRPFDVTDVVQESADVRSFHLAPADGHAVAPHRPGQFVTLRTPAGAVRSYTLSDAADGRRYRISVKHAGAVSGWLHEAALPGTRIELRGPAGDFVFEEGTGRPAVLLSAGIGITPMMAMLNGLLVNGNRSRHRYPIHLFHGARSAPEMPFGERLQALAASHHNLHVHLRFSGPDAAFDEAAIPNWDVGRGRIDIDVLKRALSFDDYDFYLCGPAPFMTQMVTGLRALHVDEARIHCEAFGPARMPGGAGRALAADATRSTGDTPSTPVVVHAARSGVDLVWDGRDASLLDFVEKHDLPAESGCRSGACGTCAAGLLGGRVDALRACSAQAGAGRILLCSTVPAADSGEITLDL